MDLQHRLEEIAGPVRPPTAAQLDADLARGRRALRRRHTTQAFAGSAFAVAALVAAFSLAGPGTDAPGTVPGGAGHPPAAVQLVAYKGKQPKGFTVDKVPDGWFIQSDDNYTLVIAPDFVKKPGPDVDPSKDPVYDPQMFVGKIVVMLESKDGNGPQGGRKVQVGDAEGVLIQDSATDTGGTVWVKQPSGTYLLVQFWDGIGLSEAQMLELTAGVTVHKGAKQGVG